LLVHEVLRYLLIDVEQPVEIFVALLLVIGKADQPLLSFIPLFLDHTPPMGDVQVEQTEGVLQQVVLDVEVYLGVASERGSVVHLKEQRLALLVQDYVEA
jgi:hypothetical protein